MLKKPSYKQVILSGLLASSFLSGQVRLVQADETSPIGQDQSPPAMVTSEPPVETVTPTPSQPSETVVPTAETPVSPSDGISQPSSSTTTADAVSPVSSPSTQPTVTIGNQIVPVTFDKPEVAPLVQSNQSDRIVTTLTENPVSEMAFNWFTKDKLAGSAVRISETPDMGNARIIQAQTLVTTNTYAERTKDGAIIFHIKDLYKDQTNVEVYLTDAKISPDNKAWTSGATYGYEILQEVTETINRAIVTGLNPDRTYYYQVGAAHLLSPVGTFRTAAIGEPDFKFIHYTDTQNGIWNENVRNEAEFGARTLNEALMTAKDAKFALHTGDVVEISQVEDEWKDVLNRSQEGYLAIPHVVASGNHDTHKTTLNDHFNLPINNQLHKGSYYSFDYNGAHFTVLNTNDNEVDADNPTGAALSDTQLAWLETDLARARQKGVNWLVVAYHKPLYSSSYHSLQDVDVQAVRERLITILDKYDVDLVLNGHDHVLTTTKPLVANIEAFADGIVDRTTTKHIDDNGNEYIDTDGTMFVIPNAAGTKLYDDIFNQSLEHIKKVRPRLAFLTQENLEDYRKLFDRSSQPGESPVFQESHSNQRDSQIQNFGIYTVTPDELRIDLYQVEGDVLKTSENSLRTPDLIASYTLVNHKFKLEDKNQEIKEGQARTVISVDNADQDKPLSQFDQEAGQDNPHPVTLDYDALPIAADDRTKQLEQTAQESSQEEQQVMKSEDEGRTLTSQANDDDKHDIKPVSSANQANPSQRAKKEATDFAGTSENDADQTKIPDLKSKEVSQASILGSNLQKVDKQQPVSPILLVFLFFLSSLAMLAKKVFFSQADE